MDDLFQGAKRAANQAVERAAWEADKRKRAGDERHEIELLRRERSALVEQLITLVRDLAVAGQLTQPQLKSLAERLATIDHDVSERQRIIDLIRNEPYVPGSVHIMVQRSPASAQPMPGAPPALPSARKPCPTCGYPVRTNAAFCSSCGTRLK
jgi:zinc ribbon protein